jgi:Flp pilus assembly pilin Flp
VPQLTWVLILLEAIGYILLHSFFYLSLLAAGLNSTQMGFLGKSPFYLWNYVVTISWVVGRGLSSTFTSIGSGLNSTFTGIGSGLNSTFTGIGTFIHEILSAFLGKTIPQSPSLPAPCTTATPSLIIGDSPLSPSPSLSSENVCPPPPYSVS